MVTYYNLTNISQSTSFLQFTQLVSTDVLGGYWIGLIILLMTFGVFFFAMYGRIQNTAAAFAVSCWMTALVATLLRPIGLIGDSYWYAALLLVPISLFMLWIKGASQ